MNFSVLIQNWFDKNSRDLPWRSSNDPYKIWLSEIILQQTRVDQGINYYLKFVDHYPTVKDLAKASEDEVLNDWQGLGYYSRARNLHAAAKTIVNEHASIFPNSYKEVLSLKGVGTYTAAAICSIAYGLPHAVVDGNVYRVLSRYFEIKTPIDSTEGKKEFEQLAQELLDPHQASKHNQALMELGALVCKPKNPECVQCPLNESCLAHKNNSWTALPVKSKKTKVRNRYLHYLVLHNGNKIVIKKRGDGDIWKGLYDFPLLEKDKNETLNQEDVKSFAIRAYDIDYELKHVLSHQHLYAKFWWCEVDRFVVKDDYQIITKDSLEDFPLPQMLIRYIQASPNFGAD